MPKSVFEESNLFCAMTKMPRLKHKSPNQPFSLKESEVVQWLVATPEAQQYLFDKARSSGAIVYDSESGTWKGAYR